MSLRIIHTGDGSTSLFDESLKEIYHSRHGALAESMHVFIEAGLEQLKKRQAINILEIGFGTGLNVFLTLIRNKSQKIHFRSLEPSPLPDHILAAMNFADMAGNSNDKDYLMAIYNCPWNKWSEITSCFYLMKNKIRLQDARLKTDNYDLIYFDAFSPDVQPELWTESQFSKIYKCMKPGGILVTYSARGAVKRAMLAAGFYIEKLPGPKGKREMIRGTKPENVL